MTSEKYRAPSPNEIPAIQDALARILESRTFRSAEGQRAFLRYIVEEAAAGRGADLKEYSIGTQALGRAETFDPRTDPIVRTQARKLRVHLTEYYQSEGAQDPIQIELPKGGYVPLFQVPASAPEPVVAEPPPPRPLPSKRLMLVFASLAITFTALAAWRVQQRHRPALDPTANQDYQRGLHLWGKLTPENLKIATRYFESAIAKQPTFAAAYSALANSYAAAPQVATASPPESAVKICSAAHKALALDPNLGEAHIQLAVCAEYDFDWQTADREFKRGLELNPNSAVAHIWYAKFLGLQGRIPEVLHHRRIAATLDPASPYAVQSMGGYYSVMGNYDEAIKYFRDALELEPQFGLARQGLGIAYVMQNRPEDAVRELKLASEQMKGPRRLALLGYGYGMLGRTAEAHQVLQDLHALSLREHVPALTYAQVYLGMGDHDRAFEWMEKAIGEKDLSLALQWDSLYEPIRKDPRYRGLLRRMKLV
jgi:tetratricopeptide (TPR) repeat protein